MWDQIRDDFREYNEGNKEEALLIHFFWDDYATQLRSFYIVPNPLVKLEIRNTKTPQEPCQGKQFPI